MEENKEIKYIAKHYRKGLFVVEPALKRIKPIASVWWTRSRIAAACIGATILTATAALFIHNNYFINPTTEIEQNPPSSIPAAEIVRAIDFEDAPLPIVVAKIKEVYGVDVVNLPDNADEYSLSLHYEGSAIDLLYTINDILDTEMTIQE
ncbi:MAG: hypothetical protein K2N35_04140 [Muribaculaceae bacterium]|nr:hypothetical protein [Muribaculaceae bacterium]